MTTHERDHNDSFTVLKGPVMVSHLCRQRNLLVNSHDHTNHTNEFQGMNKSGLSHTLDCHTFHPDE